MRSRLFSILMSCFLLSHVLIYAEQKEEFRLVAEADPIATVAGCVNVVSGDFFQIETDLTCECAEPLRLTRCYDSGLKKNGLSGYGWGLNFPINGTEPIHVQGVCGIDFEMRENAYYWFSGFEKDKQVVITMERTLRDKGVTNYSSEGISGHTNLSNIQCTFKGKAEDIKHRNLQVQLGDGTARWYGRYYINKTDLRMRLSIEDLPNTR